MNAVHHALLNAGLLVALLVAAPAVYATTTLPATGVTQTDATLWGAYTGAAGNTITWNPPDGSGAGSCVPPGLLATKSCTVTGLTCGTTYTFSAQDNLPLGGPGGNLTFTTLACPAGGAGVRAPLLNGWWKH